MNPKITIIIPVYNAEKLPPNNISVITWVPYLLTMSLPDKFFKSNKNSSVKKYFNCAGFVYGKVSLLVAFSASTL